jgi:hypothetical protein
VPSLFRRKSTDLVAERDEDAGPSDESATADQRRARTQSKRERGITTPKRVSVRRTPEPPPTSRREAFRRRQQKDRVDREERRRGMMAGDDRYLSRRDKGPERALVRDLVDSRLTIGPWFFGLSMIEMFASYTKLPIAAKSGLYLFWMSMLLLTVLDSFLITRRIKKAVKERFPNSTERLGSLYYYGIVRAIMYRRLRLPKPRIKLGETY